MIAFLLAWASGASFVLAAWSWSDRQNAWATVCLLFCVADVALWASLP